eukprot:scaffold4854_cov131-Isochrysis_galbana.AAC.6
MAFADAGGVDLPAVSTPSPCPCPDATRSSAPVCGFTAIYASSPPGSHQGCRPGSGAAKLCSACNARAAVARHSPSLACP